MIKNIKLPAPQLSQLKEVDIELEMTGRHYRNLALDEGSIPEEIVLSILKDLVKQDANKLTMSEVRYLFTLVKINALENKYVASLRCNNLNKKKKTICNHLNKCEIHLSDSDLNPTPKNYKVPTITLNINGENEYTVLPPTIDMEVALFNWYLQVKNVTPQMISENKQVALEFTWLRNTMHLVKDGEFIVKDITDFEYMISLFETQKYKTISKLYDLCNEVDSFGVQNKEYKFTCEECGGTLKFQLPLLYGLSV